MAESNMLKITGELPPFHTRDWAGNVYCVHHGDVAIDGVTDVFLMPSGDCPALRDISLIVNEAKSPDQTEEMGKQ